MRRDLIQSQEEIQRRKNAGLRNRSTSTKREDDDNVHANILLGPLTVEDREVINSIQSAFLSIIENKCDELPNMIDLSYQESELISCLQVNNEIALLIIGFCRQIGEIRRFKC